MYELAVSGRGDGEIYTRVRRAAYRGRAILQLLVILYNNFYTARPAPPAQTVNRASPTQLTRPRRTPYHASTTRRSGEIGIRTRLKISRGQLHVGSSPTSGIIPFNNLPPSLDLPTQPKNVRVHTRVHIQYPLVPL